MLPLPSVRLMRLPWTSQVCKAALALASSILVMRPRASYSVRVLLPEGAVILMNRPSLSYWSWGAQTKARQGKIALLKKSTSRIVGD